MDTRAGQDCHFFLQGYCSKGQQCPFRHDLSRAPPLASALAPRQFQASQQQECKFFLRGFCARGVQCAFRHGTAAVQAPVPAAGAPAGLAPPATMAGGMQPLVSAPHAMQAWPQGAAGQLLQVEQPAWQRSEVVLSFVSKPPAGGQRAEAPAARPAVQPCRGPALQAAAQQPSTVGLTEARKRTDSAAAPADKPKAALPPRLAARLGSREEMDSRAQERAPGRSSQGDPSTSGSRPAVRRDARPLLGSYVRTALNEAVRPRAAEPPSGTAEPAAAKAAGTQAAPAASSAGQLHDPAAPKPRQAARPGAVASAGGVRQPRAAEDSADDTRQAAASETPVSTVFPPPKSISEIRREKQKRQRTDDDAPAAAARRAPIPAPKLEQAGPRGGQPSAAATEQVAWLAPQASKPAVPTVEQRPADELLDMDAMDGDADEDFEAQMRALEEGL